MIKVFPHNKEAIKVKPNNEINTQTITPQTESLASILAVKDEWLNTRASQIAKYQGIREAKEEALQHTNHLLTAGFWLPMIVIGVSAIHIWSTVASIAPASVVALHLPDWLYHVTALAFTIIIDAVLVFLKKANTAISYTTDNKSVDLLFFYILTGLLNAAYVAAYMPGVAEEIKHVLSFVFGIVFIILLPVSIPVAFSMIETVNKQLTATKVKLRVDISALQGIIDSNLTKPAEKAQAPLNRVLEQDTYPDTILPPVDAPIEVLEDANTCMRCNALLPDLGDKRRNQGKRMSTKKHGCAACKDATGSI